MTSAEGARFSREVRGHAPPTEVLVRHPGEFDNFRSSNVNFPTPGHLVNVKFPISPLKFLTQQTIFDVKIPTLGELHDAKFPWVAPPQSWGIP